MKLKTSNPIALAVAKYYGFTSHGKFAAWLNSMCPDSKVLFVYEDTLCSKRVARIKHLYFYA